MAVVYEPRSFYARTNMKSSYLDYTNAPAVTLDSDQSQLIIDPKYQHRPDKLSYDLYQSAKYWWVFAVCNRDVLEDPVWDFVAGLQILVPSPQSVQRIA